MKSGFVSALLLASSVVLQSAQAKLYEEGKTHYHTSELTTVPEGSNDATPGWSQSVKFTLMKPNDFEEPRFMVQLVTKKPADYEYETNGFYQIYFQLLNRPVTNQALGVKNWENAVISLKYNFNSAQEVTDINYFLEGNECGTSLLKDVTFGNYRATKPDPARKCSNPWRKTPEDSKFEDD